MKTGPVLTDEQRQQILAWLAAGHNYPYIKQHLLKLGLPLVTRQAVNYYKQHYGRRGVCPTCGQVVTEVPISPPAPATQD